MIRIVEKWWPKTSVPTWPFSFAGWLYLATCKKWIERKLSRDANSSHFFLLTLALEQSIAGKPPTTTYPTIFCFTMGSEFIWLRILQVILFQTDCVIFYTNLLSRDANSSHFFSFNTCTRTKHRRQTSYYSFPYHILSHNGIRVYLNSHFNSLGIYSFLMVYTNEIES